ncbi:unnamed protein product [Amoebophrya sp. A120]|nr:unnamed protein product [Amoebophrya sp. A120]|eukprot:GSA120T00003560001.1
MFRPDTMYEMVRVGGLLFGTNHPIDLVLQESVFWKMVARELLQLRIHDEEVNRRQESKQIVAQDEHQHDKEIARTSTSERTRTTARTTTSPFAHYDALHARLIAKYGAQRAALDLRRSTVEEAHKVHSDLFVLASDRYFHLFNLEEDPKGIEKEGETRTAGTPSTGATDLDRVRVVDESGDAVSRDTRSHQEIGGPQKEESEFQHQPILREALSHEEKNKVLFASNANGAGPVLHQGGSTPTRTRFAGVPLNVLSWKTTLSHVRKSTKEELRYGPCLQMQNCLKFPSLPANATIGTVPAGYDVFASDLALDCNSGAGGTTSSVTTAWTDHLDLLKNFPTTSEEAKMRRREDLTRAMADNRCASYEFLYNTAISGTFAVNPSGPDAPENRKGIATNEGNVVYLCQHPHTCIPELLNVAPEVPRVVV